MSNISIWNERALIYTFESYHDFDGIIDGI